MSKVTVTNLTNINGQVTSAVTTINSNIDTLGAAFDNTLSRDGTSPNQMAADLDMNGHNILNLTNLVLPSIPSSDPHINGALWNSGGVLHISAG